MRTSMPASAMPYNAAAKVAALLFALASIAPMHAAVAQVPVVERSVGTLQPASQPTSQTTTQPTTPSGRVASPPATAATPAPPAVAAKSFVTIGDKPAIMFDAPSTRANKTFIVNALTPLEVLVKLDKWTKVRDTENANGWIENTFLGERRHVQISATSAEVRAMPAANAALVFDAQRAVLLEVTGPIAADAWLPVRHRDGQTGYVRLTQIWGD